VGIAYQVSSRAREDGEGARAFSAPWQRDPSPSSTRLATAAARNVPVIRSCRGGHERHRLAVYGAPPRARGRSEDHEHAQHQDRGEDGVEVSGERAEAEEVVEDGA